MIKRCAFIRFSNELTLQRKIKKTNSYDKGDYIKKGLAPLKGKVKSEKGKIKGKEL